MMKYILCSLLSVNLLTCSYAHSAPNSHKDFIIKEVFRNNYGIVVSKSEWIQRGRNGTITKVQKDGATIHETYVDGLLHGEITTTFPHSETIALIRSYDKGTLLAKKYFFVNGLPSKEEVFGADGVYTVSLWPESKELDTISTPYFIESSQNGKVLRGFYSSPNGSKHTLIEDGHGIRSMFSPNNILLTEEQFVDGVMIKHTAFYPNQDPATITQYQNGLPHGLRTTYLVGGIPETMEEWRYGQQDGLTVLFKNGCKVAEICYVQGRKHGLELRYNEQDAIAEELSWKNNQLHGVRKIYAGGIYKQEWYHRGKPVSQVKFERLNAQH